MAKWNKLVHPTQVLLRWKCPVYAPLHRGNPILLIYSLKLSNMFGASSMGSSQQSVMIASHKSNILHPLGMLYFVLSQEEPQDCFWSASSELASFVALRLTRLRILWESSDDGDSLAVEVSFPSTADADLTLENNNVVKNKRRTGIKRNNIFFSSHEWCCILKNETIWVSVKRKLALYSGDDLAERLPDPYRSTF